IQKVSRQCGENHRRTQDRESDCTTLATIELRRVISLLSSYAILRSSKHEVSQVRSGCHIDSISVWRCFCGGRVKQTESRSRQVEGPISRREPDRKRGWENVRCRETGSGSQWQGYSSDAV